MKYSILIASSILILFACKKTKTECPGANAQNFGFTINEAVLDSLYPTDTAYIERDILLRVNNSYQAISWKVGDDPRTFSSSEVRLRFQSPEQLAINLTAQAINQNCGSISVSTTQSLVLLPPSVSVPSPLVGVYKGYNVDNPADTFSVAIKFWYGSRYNWWKEGAYSVENLPKLYRDTTQNFNGFTRPEITGIIASAGYKNIGIERRGNLSALGIKGYGHLRRGQLDTLRFNYTIIDTARFRQTGQLTYLNKTFIGIKN